MAMVANCSLRDFPIESVFGGDSAENTHKKRVKVGLKGGRCVVVGYGSCSRKSLDFAVGMVLFDSVDLCWKQSICVWRESVHDRPIP